MTEVVRSVSCGRCGRPLSRPRSQEAGYGPICLARLDRDSGTWEAEGYEFLAGRVGEGRIVLCRRPNGVIAGNIPWAHRHHSPSGFEWGSDFLGVMHLNMAICAKQVESLGVRLYLSDGHRSSLGTFLAPVHVMEVEGGEVAGVSAPDALPAESELELAAGGSFLVAPAAFFAPGAGVLPTLVAGVDEEDAARIAAALALQIDTSTPVFFIRGEDLPAIGAPVIANASNAVGGLAVFSVRDAGAAVRAIQRWVGSHDLSSGINYALLSAVLPWTYAGSGPSDLALNIAAVIAPTLGPGGGGMEPVKLADGTYVSALAFAMHQDLKFRFIAPLDRDAPEVFIDGAELDAWASEFAKVWAARSYLALVTPEVIVLRRFAPLVAEGASA